MKTLILALAILAVSAVATAQQDQSVNGYYRSNGTYVQPYHRSAPDNTRTDNYSTRGNVNPYTGAAGTQNPYYAPPVRSYSPPVYTPPVYQPYQPAYQQAPQPSYNGGCCSR